MPSIFISYRRKDTGGHAGRIKDRLELWFDKNELFYDVASIKPGEEFPDRIRTALADAKVVLIVVGPDWEHEFTERISNVQDKDCVREEVELALERYKKERILLIPLLVGRESSLDYSKLPNSIADLKNIEIHELAGKDDDWQHQFDRLLGILRSIPGVPEPRFRQPQLPEATNAGFAKLEILCDRVIPEHCLIQTIKSRMESKKPFGWLLFGECDQAHCEMHERIRDYSFKNYLHGNQQGCFRTFLLNNLGSLHHSIERLKSGICEEAGSKLGYDIDSLGRLYDVLHDKRISGALLYAVVAVKDEGEVNWWRKTLKTLLDELERIENRSALIAIAFSIQYEREKTGIFSFLSRKSSMQKYFLKEFPELYSDSGDVSSFNPDVSQLINRLTPAGKSDVRQWCDHEVVRESLGPIPVQQLLSVFGDKDELPMQIVLNELRKKINERHQVR